LRSTSPLWRRLLFASRIIKLLDPQIDVNVVTARWMFNNRAAGYWFRPVAIDSAASRVI
jgi:hypothetical protein